MISRTLDCAGVHLSRLGFGCVNLTTHTHTRDALRLLREALDAGITHFDVARLYGLGRAEGILGEFLRTIARERVTVATKFGLAPPAALSGRPSLIRMGKAVVRFIPGLRKLAHRTLKARAPAPRFGVREAAESLEASLRALGCEYVDLLLLHEAGVADASGPELLDYLERERQAGRVRGFGVASHISQLTGNLNAFPTAYQVFQFNNAAPGAEITHLAGTAGKLLITHSALAPLKRIRQAMAARGELVREWSNRIGLDLADERVVAGLLLDYALQSNDRGTVLFATMRSEHLRDNVRYANGGLRNSSEQVDLFHQYCRLLVADAAA